MDCGNSGRGKAEAIVSANDFIFRFSDTHSRRILDASSTVLFIGRANYQSGNSPLATPALIIPMIRTTIDRMNDFPST
jgi:hypothetical protein